MVNCTDPQAILSPEDTTTNFNAEIFNLQAEMFRRQALYDSEIEQLENVLREKKLENDLREKKLENDLRENELVIRELENGNRALANDEKRHHRVIAYNEVGLEFMKWVISMKTRFDELTVIKEAAEDEENLSTDEEIRSIRRTVVAETGRKVESVLAAYQELVAHGIQDFAYIGVDEVRYLASALALAIIGEESPTLKAINVRELPADDE